MRESLSKHKPLRKSTGIRLASVLDLIAICPKCGGEVGLWSEEAETLCTFCEYRVFEKERTVH
jgi:DNA-directed RNA polymerase subunit RPC12/RpoP